MTDAGASSLFRLLFLCTGNSGRSQMAAAFAGTVGPQEAEIICAGDKLWDIEPAAIKTMREIGLDMPTAVKHSLNDVKSSNFDVVVTLCNQAAKTCPTFPGSPARIHWPLDDPAKRDNGIPEEEMYRTVRDNIRDRIVALFQHGFLEALQQVRMTFGSLLDNLTDGVMAHDLERRIYFFNTAAQRITGYAVEDVVGRDCHEIFPGRFCGGDCSFCEEPMEAHSRFRYPQSFIRKDGERRDLEMSVVTVNTPRQEIVGALVIFRDVSEVNFMRKKLVESRSFHGIVGRHPSMLKVFQNIQELSDINVPILIQGESGTGKEIVATSLHQLSIRSAGPFVPVNCGALPEGTLESELFGHVKG
ncbi:sigma 54-interacting transcriptional regulator, partial [bacterium]|nr:sigma 54-interacting transcriptional regulator [bacterium]